MTDDKPTVTLLDGRGVSSWGEEWRRETFERELLVIDLMKLPSKEARRARLAQFEIDTCIKFTALGHSNPDAVAKEARRRAEQTALARWERQRAVSFAAN